MNPPALPQIKIEPKMSDIQRYPAPAIIAALRQLYDCAFRSDPSQHTHLMEGAHTAPRVLADAIHELLYWRQQIEDEAARAELEDQAAHQSSTVNRQSPRPPTAAELEDDIAVQDRLHRDMYNRLCTASGIALAASEGQDELTREDLLGTMNLITATLHRPLPDHQDAKSTKTES